MLLLGDGGLENGGVVGVGDQADDNGVLANLVLQGVGVVDVEGDWVAVLQALGELLGRLKRTACCQCCERMRAGSQRDGVDLPTVTCTPASLRIWAVGRVTKPAPRRRTFLLIS